MLAASAAAAADIHDIRRRPDLMGVHDSFASSGLTYLDGKWQEGNVPLMGSMTHAAWLASVVFDGARAIRGMAPDLDMHCERCVDSAQKFDLKPPVTAEEMVEIAWEGIKKFPEDAVLYVRPMVWAESGFVAPDPDSTRFAMVLTNSPIPDAPGFTACLSSFRRPTPEAAPTDAKAGCLYPNSARALREAASRGFDNGVVRDQNGNVAEFATANLFYVKDGGVFTPQLNGTFLNGVTRRRIIQLLRDEGEEVIEKNVTYAEVMDADEIFSSGNYSKVSPLLKLEDRDLQAGPIAKKALSLYMDYAASKGTRA
jgi:branched-chain amino acid aminotransferase